MDIRIAYTLTEGSFRGHEPLAEDDVVSHTGFYAGFNPVTVDIDGDPIEIEFHVVVIEKEDDEPILQVFVFILPPTQTEVWIPEEGEFTTTDD